ncbi:MAG: hypothetical protein RR726_02460 [Pseudomonas sp.]
MQMDAFIAESQPELPFEIRYEGGDAADHRIEMSSLAESLDGFSRIYAVVGHFVATGEYAKQLQALGAKAYAQETEAKCFSVAGALAWATANGIFQGLGVAVFTGVLTYVYQRNSGNKEEMKHLRELFEKQLGFNQKVSERMLDTIDRLSDGLQPSVKKSVAPIGETCDRIDLYTGGNIHKTIDLAEKEAILDEEPTVILPEREYSVLITEMDRLRRTCKVSFTGPDSEEGVDEEGAPRRLNGEITDPVVTLEESPYLSAFITGKPVLVKAKAMMRNSLISKLYISDARQA